MEFSFGALTNEGVGKRSELQAGDYFRSYTKLGRGPLRGKKGSLGFGKLEETVDSRDQDLSEKGEQKAKVDS